MSHPRDASKRERTRGPERVFARLARGRLGQFLRLEATSGLVLLIAAVAAVAWASSPWSDSYARVWHAPLTLELGSLVVVRSVSWFVDDVLMTLFFFVVGLELRREREGGVLSEWRRAALPGAAALGGMIAPALVYLALVGDGPARRGWGVPTATDIAFALGALALLGSRVTRPLRVLLLTLAVIDDLGATLIVALFYSHGLAWSGIAIAAAGVIVIVALRAARVKGAAAFVIPALVVWSGTSASGAHPAIAGVALGLLVRGRASDGVSTVERWIAILHPWVAFGVMPLFALANAGVALDVSTLRAGAGVTTAVVAGLVVGKPLGIVLATALAVRAGIARLPDGLGPTHVVVLGVVSGIGFTMALFVGALAFSDPAVGASVRVGVLAASLLSTSLTLVVGRALLPRPLGA